PEGGTGTSPVSRTSLSLSQPPPPSAPSPTSACQNASSSARQMRLEMRKDRRADCRQRSATNGREVAAHPTERPLYVHARAPFALGILKSAGGAKATRDVQRAVHSARFDATQRAARAALPPLYARASRTHRGKSSQCSVHAARRAPYAHACAASRIRHIVRRPESVSARRSVPRCQGQPCRAKTRAGTTAVRTGARINSVLKPPACAHRSPAPFSRACASAARGARPRAREWVVVEKADGVHIVQRAQGVGVAGIEDALDAELGVEMVEEAALEGKACGTPPADGDGDDVSSDIWRRARSALAQSRRCPARSHNMRRGDVAGAIYETKRHRHHKIENKQVQMQVANQSGFKLRSSESAASSACSGLFLIIVISSPSVWELWGQDFSGRLTERQTVDGKKRRIPNKRDPHKLCTHAESNGLFCGSAIGVHHDDADTHRGASRRFGLIKKRLTTPAQPNFVI
ncbi:hypothetical protein C8J57DRAFT_1642933, partial [Mycena rebaudengoi]